VNRKNLELEVKPELRGRERKEIQRGETREVEREEREKCEKDTRDVQSEKGIWRERLREEVS